MERRSLKITRRGEVVGAVAGMVAFALIGLSPSWDSAPWNQARPAEPVVEQVMEDDPAWDCRTMGNRTCGVLIHGDRYLLTFGADGAVDVERAR